jgi:hypothetical protein
LAPRAENEGQLSQSPLEHWMNRISLARSEGSFSLKALGVDGVQQLRFDLETILEAAQELTGIVARAVDREPSGDLFETMLIDIEVQLAQAQAHWESIMSRLRRSGQWHIERLRFELDDPD